MTPPDRSVRARIALEPAGLRDWLANAVHAGGGELVAVEDASAVVWATPDDPDALAALLRSDGDHLGWVQLPWAGIEPYVPVLDHDRAWTCGKGVYADPVAELAMALALAGMRGIGRYARSKTWREKGAIGTNLRGARVVVLGGGGIAESFLRLLAPFGCRATVVRRRPEVPVAVPGVRNPGVEEPRVGEARVGEPIATVGLDDLDQTVAGADLVVLALAATPATVGIVDAHLLEVMGPGCHLVNVARGSHVVTDDLVAALAEGAIAWAGLDVTDPEPLPDGHPLWNEPNCIVTPHVGNTPAMALPLLTRRITANIERWIDGRPLLGPVDPDAGY